MSGEGFGFLLAAPVVIAGALVVGSAYVIGGVAYGTIRLGVAAAELIAENNRKNTVSRNSAPYRRIANGVKAEPDKVAAKPTVKAAVFQYNSGIDLDELNSKLDGVLAENQTILEEKIRTESDAMILDMREMDRRQLNDYINSIGATRTAIVSEMNNIFQNIETEGVAATDKLLNEYKNECAANNDSLLDAIKAYKSANAGRDDFEKEICEQYIAELKQLLSDVKEAFERSSDDKRFAAINNSYEEAIDNYEAGNYQACIAVMLTMKSQIGEFVLNLEREQNLWNAAYQMAVTAVEQVKVYLDSQTGFNGDYKEVLAASGMNVDIPDDLEGIEFKYYAKRDNDGNNELISVINEVNRVLTALKKANANNTSVEELKKIAEKMTTNTYPEAISQVNKCVDNIANRYYRMLEAEKFEEFLMDKGLRVCWVENEKIDNDGVEDDTATIILAVRDERMEESVLYSFENHPDGSDAGVVQIHYDMAESSDMSESRNEYYRGLINEFTGANVECSIGTEGRVSSNITEDKEKALEQLTADAN